MPSRSGEERVKRACAHPCVRGPPRPYLRLQRRSRVALRLRLRPVPIRVLRGDLHHALQQRPRLRHVRRQLARVRPQRRPPGPPAGPPPAGPPPA
eukprot:514932-Prorocentrum_minimum.AAC.1